MEIDIEDDLFLLAWQRVQELSDAHLLCFVCSKNAQVRTMVIQQFHGRPSHETFKIAKKLIHDKKAVARESGYLILGQLGYPNRPYRPESMPLIMAGLRTEKLVSVRGAIAVTIGHIKPPVEFHEEIIGVFSRYVDSNKVSLQREVAFGMCGLSRSENLERLIKKVIKKSNHDEDVLDWIEIALEFIEIR